MSNQLNSTDQSRLDNLYTEFKELSTQFLGYPCSLDYDYEDIFRFMTLSINNVGDPYAPNSYRINTHDFECEVIRWFSDLVKLDPDEAWGYVTNGGVMVNSGALWVRREMYPEGMVYYSEDTHYSVAKILRILHARSIQIKSQDNGELDYEDLAETINIHRDVPAIIFANIGTTMKGAYDDLDKIKHILHDHAVTNYYIHADAALGGMILPFVKEPQSFTFADGIDSISISGHKMVGSPIPCGVVLARQKNVDQITRAVEYIGSLDTTISGSRNGITPLFLWKAIQTKGIEGFTTRVVNCMALASYMVGKLNHHGIKAWCHKNSTTVVFEKLAEPILHKWQIAIHGNIGHVIVMPHVTREQLDHFVDDIIEYLNEDGICNK